jgi:ATP-dependent DNA helicase RecQ
MAENPRALLRRHFGYPEFRPGQEELVEAVMSGQDALGVLPTGGGKSVCYQIPAHASSGLTLVITPLVSLMQDQLRRAAAGGLRGGYLSATLSAAQKRSVLRRAREGRLNILFVAPERLELPGFRQELRNLDVRLLAVDEAHCISEWGHEFRPSYRRIGALRDLVQCPILALTATATPEVRADIEENLRLRNPQVVVRSFDRPNLSWVVARADGSVGRVRAIHQLLNKRPGPAIVYAPTRGTVESVRDRLAASGMAAGAYHAGLSGAARTAVQSSFMNDRCRVVVATNAFGMGIDKADVRTVVHFALPSTLEAYYQEAGRAGRDGLDAICVAFYAKSDLRTMRRLAERAHPPRSALRAALRTLGRLKRHGAHHGFGVEELSGGEDAEVIAEALERLGAVAPSGTPRSVCEDDPWSASSRRRWRYVNHRMNPAPLLARRRTVLTKLRAVRRFAAARGCRRRALLRYFGEHVSDGCGKCDRCQRALSIRIRAAL